MSRSNSAECTGHHAARFDLAISESEYQKTVHTLHWRLRNCEHGKSQSPEETYKLIHGWTQSESRKYSGQISSLCLITLSAGYREVSLSLLNMHFT
jgi:hypothetical protein